MISFEETFLKIHLFNPLIGHKTFQFSPKDSIGDLRNTLCQTTDLMMYQNFHLQYDNKILCQFFEMGEKLSSGAKVNIVFNPFDQRSSKFHYNKIKILLENPAILVNHNFSYQENFVRKEIDSLKMKISDNIADFVGNIEKQSYIQPKLLQLEHKFQDLLNFSGFNPVPYYRKLMGDFYYIYFKSPQEIDCHITCHSQGFYLNQSTNSHFNPSISTKNTKTYICLLDLLYAISPKFKQNFKDCLNKIKSNEYQRFLIGSLSTKKADWMVDGKCATNQTNTWKINSIQKAYKREQILNIKDWNEMFQIQHLEPSQSYYEKINREKLKFKIYQQFVDHAKLGAVNIIEKSILPMNINCPKRQQTFLFANIYYTYVDNSLQQKQLTQILKNLNNDNYCNKLNRKQSKLTNNYILNLQLIDNTEGIDLHLSHSVLIQYKGQKLRAQSFPSSLIHSKAKGQQIQDIIQRRNIINTHLNKEKSSNCMMNYNKQIGDSLLKVTFKLNLQYENVIRQLEQQNRPVRKIVINSDIKGIQTIDKKKYLFNLHTLMAKDYNFISSNQSKPLLQSKSFQQQKQNINFYNNDDFYVYRPELIELYNEKFRCRIPINTMLGKNLNGKYQVVMNQRLRAQEKKLKSIGNFAKENVINMVITALETDNKKYLADTKNIIDVMHKYGLNCRYLGFLYKKIDKKKSPQLQIMIQKVVYIKCIKNILNSALKIVSYGNCRFLTSHILNCIFYPQKVNSSQYMNWKSLKQQDQQTHNNQISKKRKKKNKQKQQRQKKEDSLLTLANEQNGQFFLNIKPEDLNKLIRKIAKIKYNFVFDNQESSYIELKTFKYLYGKSSVLRDICLNSGIVLQRKNYFINDKINFIKTSWINDKSNTNSNERINDKQNQSGKLFLPQNIVNFYPRCTHTNPDKKQLDNLIAQGDHFLSQFFVQQSIQSYNKAIQYILTTFGGNNQKLPLIHKKLSFIYFKIGDIQTALLFGTHSLGMFEEFYGYENVQTIDNLSILGIYYCAQRNFIQAQQCLFRALYYSYIAYGQIYPQILTLWLNLSTCYQMQKKYTESIMCLVEGLKICLKIFTENHLNTSIYYAALSAIHFQLPDIMNAIRYKEKSLNILNKLLPQNDLRVKQSAEMLEYLKSLQSSKKIKQIHQKQMRKMHTSNFGYPQPHINPWEHNGRNFRGNINNGNPMMTFGNRQMGRMQEYFMRQSQQFWRRTAGGGRKVR